MVKSPYCQYTIKFSYGDDEILQEALRLLQVENKEDLQEALRSMIMETAEELITEKNVKEQTTEKKSDPEEETESGMYICLECQKEFNKIFRFAWQKLKCPKCGSKKIAMTGHY